jgi:hypothetical protein
MQQGLDGLQHMGGAAQIDDLKCAASQIDIRPRLT